MFINPINAMTTDYNAVVNGIYYHVTDFVNREVEVVSPTNMITEAWTYFQKTDTYVNTVTIPEYVEFDGREYKVTAIGDAAFATCDIEAINIPKTVLSIKKYAFYSCKLLSSIILPDNVTSIGESAFAECINLQNTKISTGIKEIGSWAFRNCYSLSSIELPNELTHIGEQTFENCNLLTSVTIPNSFKSTDGSPFYNCTSLSEVTIDCPIIPENLSFNNCPISTLLLTNNVSEIKGGIFWMYLKNLKTIKSLNKTPPTVEAYWSEVYNNCTLIVPKGSKEAYIQAPFWNQFSTISEIESTPEPGGAPVSPPSPNNVEYKYPNYKFTEKGRVDGLFYNLDPINKVAEVTSGNNYYKGAINIPSIIEYAGTTYSVVSIGDEAFNNCDEISSMKMPNSIVHIGMSAFEDCRSMKSIQLSNSIVVIEGGAFRWCENTFFPELPQCLEYIGDVAFQSCDGIKTINIPQSVKEIGMMAFGYCTNLVSFTFPNKVDTIRSDFFEGCDKLETVTWSSSVKYVERQLFRNCNNLLDIYCYAEKAKGDEDVFNRSHPEYITLHVPASSINYYKNTSPWNQCMSIIPITDTSITNIEKTTSEEQFYNIEGKQLKNKTKGLNIIKMSDGTTKKVFIK